MNNNDISWSLNNNSLFIGFFLDLMVSSTNYLQLVFYIREDQVTDILKGVVSLDFVGAKP